MKNMRLIHKIGVIALLIVLVGVPVFAAETAPTNPWEIFQTVFKMPLIIIGALMTIFGGISMGMAFHSDDASKQTQGMMVLISGVMVLALGIFLGNFSGAVEQPDGGDIGVNTETDKTKGPNGAESAPFANILNQLGSWIPMLGFIVMFWGFFEMAKAMKSDDAAGKHKALAFIMGGAALWQIINFMKLILWGTL